MVTNLYFAQFLPAPDGRAPEFCQLTFSWLTQSGIFAYQDTSCLTPVLDDSFYALSYPDSETNNSFAWPAVYLTEAIPNGSGGYTYTNNYIYIQAGANRVIFQPNYAIQVNLIGSNLQINTNVVYNGNFYFDLAFPSQPPFPVLTNTTVLNSNPTQTTVMPPTVSVSNLFPGVIYLPLSSGNTDPLLQGVQNSWGNTQLQTWLDNTNVDDNDNNNDFDPVLPLLPHGPIPVWFPQRPTDPGKSTIDNWINQLIPVPIDNN